MGAIKISAKNKTTLKKILTVLLSFFAGALLVFIIFVIYYNRVQIPEFRRILQASINEKQKIIDELSAPKQPSITCPDQIYNIEQIKEFYSLQTTEDSWQSFTSKKVGIKFEYPIEANKHVIFEFFSGQSEYGTSGTSFSWSTKDMSDNFAWGASKDFKAGRMGVDIYKWTEQGGKYFIHSAPGNPHQVEELFVRNMPFGTEALLYKSPCFFFCDDPEILEPEETNLIVNLPYNHRPNVESIIFKIPETFSNEDIERLIQSIQLINP